jgi:hypothetical protein
MADDTLPPTIDDLLSHLPPPHLAVQASMRSLAYHCAAGSLHNVAAELMRAIDACDEPACAADQMGGAACNDCLVRTHAALILMNLTEARAVPRLVKP